MHMITKGRKPPAILMKISIVEKVKKCKHVQRLLQDGEIRTGNRAITAQTNQTRKLWNNRKLWRLKSWKNVVQEDHIGQLWFDIEWETDTEDVRMMLEASLADTINTTGLETS